MKKRFLSCLLVLTLLFAALPAVVFADASLSNFKVIKEYSEGQFSDVKAGDWYASNVATAVRMGLLYGSAPDRFNVTGSVTLAEAITMAARLHSIYYSGSADFVQGDPWYQVYVDYALENGIISQPYIDYKRDTTRAEYAVILARALPATALPQINEVEDGAIPDVPITRSYAAAVYGLYRAGVLTGYSGGIYKPDNNVSRSEIAAIVTRMADPSLRKELTLTKDNAGGVTYTAAEIAARFSSAVFYIEIYDAYDEPLGSGSGFFIDPSGIAVTNFHVMDGARRAIAKTTDGKEYDIPGIYSYSEENDVAIIKVDGSDFPTLEMGDSGSIVAGQTVFAIGSPLGLENSISQGIISNVNRVLDDQTFIQMTAPISPGSSGGALLDASGSVIGITSGYMPFEYDAQNLNLAVPINIVKGMSTAVMTALSDITPSSLGYYYVYPAKSALTLLIGKSESINVYQSMGEEATLSYEIENESGEETVVSCEWGDWTDTWDVPIKITGAGEGTCYIHLRLKDDAGNVYDEDYIYVTVRKEAIDVGLSASPSSLTIAKGESAATRVTLDKVDGFYLYSTVADTSVVSTVWGEWITDNSLPLTVYGLKAGNTTIRIDVYDKYEVFVKSIYIAVTVN